MTADPAIGTHVHPPPQEADARRATARGLWRLGVALSLAGAVVVPLVQFALLFPLVGVLPTWDQWSMAEVWEAHLSGRPVAPLLLKPYNGHLNVIPRVVFFGLGLLTDWNLTYEVLASYALACGSLILLIDLLRRTDERLVVLATPTALLVFSLHQFENFLSGYPMGQHLSQFMALLAVHVISTSSGSSRGFGGAVAAALVSTFSYGAGLAVWVAGLLVAVVRRTWSRAQVCVWSACAISVGLAVQAAASPGALPALPANSLDFFLSVIGRSVSWSPMPPRPTAVVTGVVLLAAFVALSFAGWRSLQRRLAVSWVSIGLLGVQSAALVTFARAAAGWEHALTSHYVTAIYPITVSILALLGMIAFDSRRLAPTLFAAVTIVVSMLVVASSIAWLPVLRGWAGIIQTNNCRIIFGTATDQEIRTSHHPDAALVRHGSQLLRNHRLGAFRNPESELKRSCAPALH